MFSEFNIVIIKKQRPYKPTGIAVSVIRALKDLNFTGFDVVEVAPPYDHSEITAYMGANIIFEFMSILAYQKKIGKRK